MRVDLERTLTLADIINKGVVALAVVCAGIWALYKYVIQESPAAQLALDQLKRACSERGSLDIKLSSRNSGNMILGTVSLKNIGTRRVDLDLTREMPIAITELVFADGKPRPLRSLEVGFPFFHEDNLIKWHTPSILPGRTTELSFAASVGQPGTYLISFRGGSRQILPDGDDCRNISSQEKAGETGWFWAATAIQLVLEASEATSKVSHQKQK